MKNVLLTLLHLAVMTAKLCGPGGVRAVIAENLLLKQQLIILRRAPAGAQPDAERPAALRIQFAPAQSRTYPKACHRHTPFDALGVSCRVGTSHVPSTVLIEELPPEARPEGPKPDTHPRTTELSPRTFCTRPRELSSHGRSTGSSLAELKGVSAPADDPLHAEHGPPAATRPPTARSRLPHRGCDPRDESRCPAFDGTRVARRAGDGCRQS